MGVLADETRLKIVRGLFADAQCVAALAKRVGLPVARISHHLAILRAAGIVEGERDGQRVVYQLSREFHTSPRSHTLDFGCCLIRFLPLESDTCEVKTES
jgi:DNA-binding transcriptional ArsR family regulator